MGNSIQTFTDNIKCMVSYVISREILHETLSEAMVGNCI